MVLEFTTNNDREVLEVLKQWDSLSEPVILSDEALLCIKNSFEYLGFKDVVVRSDGKADGTKEGQRYFGMFLKGQDYLTVNNEAVTVNMTMEYQ